MNTIPAKHTLVLGSGSPRRRRLLKEAGFAFEVVATDAEEIFDQSNPAGTVAFNALAKNTACRALRPDADILTADTLVWFEGRLIGKPSSKEEAAQFLRSFSGKEQTVFTAVAFSRPGDQTPALRIEASLVKFKVLSEEAIADYIRIVNPLDRAGAYDAADYGDMVIEKVTGSYSNVIGLPMETVIPLLGCDKHLSAARRSRF